MTQSIFKLITNISEKARHFKEKLPLSQQSPAKKGLLHIEVEKYLNGLYSLENIKQKPLNIVLVSKACGGFGDVIWGIRAIESLKKIVPHAKFSIISDAMDKFALFVSPSPNLELIEVKPNSPNFTDKTKGKEILSNCDLVIDGPYLWHLKELSRVFGVDLKFLEEKNRYLQGIEYDCERYSPNWEKQIGTQTFFSGLAPNAYGIFIIEDLIKKIKASPTSEELKLSIQKLKNEPLKQTINRLNPEASYPMYFGYGELYPAKFLELVSRLEDKNQSNQDIIILLNSRDPKALEKFTNSLKTKPLQNISSISLVEDIYPISDAELEAIDKRTQNKMIYDPLWLAKAKQEQQALREQIPAGQTFLTKTTELINFGKQGKKIQIVEPNNLGLQDMMEIYQFTNALTMATGDQSLSECLSANKQIVYDPRKKDTLLQLINLAQSNNLPLIANWYELFNQNGTVEQMLDILSNPEFRVQNEQMNQLSQKQDLAKSLQEMLCRRIILNQYSGLAVLESELHEAVEEVFTTNPESNSQTTKLNAIQRLEKAEENLFKALEGLKLVKNTDYQTQAWVSLTDEQKNSMLNTISFQFLCSNDKLITTIFDEALQEIRLSPKNTEQKTKLIVSIESLKRNTLENFQNNTPGFTLANCLYLGSEARVIAKKVKKDSLTQKDVDQFILRTKNFNSHPKTANLLSKIIIVLGCIAAGIAVGALAGGVVGGLIGGVTGLFLSVGAIALTPATRKLIDPEAKAEKPGVIASISLS